jgi:hypothetical protein
MLKKARFHWWIKAARKVGYCKKRVARLVEYCVVGIMSGRFVVAEVERSVSFVFLW